MEQQINVEKLLQDLQSNDAYTRKIAAEEIGKLSSVDERVLNALNAVSVGDSNKYVRSAAAESYLTLAPGKMPQPISSEQSPAQITPQPTYKTKSEASTYSPSAYAASSYAGLRGIASLCTGLGWLIVILAGLSALSGLATLGNSFLAGTSIIIASVVTGGLSWIILRVIAEGISVLLDIEANTRRAAVILEERLKQK